MTIDELAILISNRDNCSLNNAYELIDNCTRDLQYAHNIEEAESMVYDWLGLEPDYLDILLM